MERYQWLFVAAIGTALIAGILVGWSWHTLAAISTALLGVQLATLRWYRVAALMLGVAFLSLAAAAHGALPCQPDGCLHPCTTEVSCGDSGETQEIWCGCAADYLYTCYPTSECSAPPSPTPTATPAPTPTPVVLHRMSPETKDSLRTTTDALDATVALAGVTGALFAAGGDVPAAAVFGVSMAAMGAASTLIKQAVDHDPPDKAWRHIFRPQLEPVPPAVRGQVLRQLARNELWMKALARALYVSVNRANSAAAAGDQIAEDKQQGAIDDYLHELSAAFRAEVRVRLAAAHRLEAHPNPLTDPAMLQQLRDAAAALSK